MTKAWKQIDRKIEEKHMQAKLQLTETQLKHAHGQCTEPEVSLPRAKNPANVRTFQA